MQGRRVYGVEPHKLEPGDFTKRPVQMPYGEFDAWWYCTPNGLIGRLSMPEDVAGRPGMSACHHVEEHEDGLISVLPQPGNSNSILAEGWNKKYGEERATISWHGYIRHGVWEGG